LPRPTPKAEVEIIACNVPWQIVEVLRWEIAGLKQATLPDGNGFSEPMGFFGCAGMCPALSRPRRVFQILSEEVMKNFALKVQRFLKSEDGPTAVEYAIMLALIVIVCLTAIQAIGTNASSAFNDIATDIDAARTMGGF
jgi:pilus assembly protein Flp/PilA